MLARKFAIGEHVVLGLVDEDPRLGQPCLGMPGGELPLSMGYLGRVMGDDDANERRGRPLLTFGCISGCVACEEYPAATSCRLQDVENRRLEAKMRVRNNPSFISRTLRRVVPRRKPV